MPDMLRLAPSMSSYVPRLSRRTSAGVVAVLLAGTIGCKDLVGSQPQAAGTTDPTTYETPTGTLLKVAGVRGLFSAVENKILLTGGAITDELQAVALPGGLSAENVLDVHSFPEGQGSAGEGLYNSLHNMRVSAALAVAAMRRSFPDSLHDVRGEMFAIQGYSEIFLAEFFCSGVPLSMPVEGGDLDYEPSITRDSLYEHALALFDSAIVLATDSESITTLAKVGKGRALLELGQRAAAASAVQDVPTAALYQMHAIVGGGNLNRRVENTDFYPLNAADREGQVGLAYREDPRSQAESFQICARVDANSQCLFVTVYYPLKYPQTAGDSSTVIAASGIEARLIEAEAALDANPNSTQWLDVLNALRTSGFVGDPDSASSWVAGSGGVAGLPALSDPGAGLSANAAAKARVDTLFAERAEWLYLTGHRQGDLRRMLRQYGYNEYPRGPYPGFSVTYGGDVTLAIPITENHNKFYHGCLDRAP